MRNLSLVGDVMSIQSTLFFSLGNTLMVMSCFPLATLGVFAQYSVNDQADVFKAPAHLTDAEAAGLSLSGLTAYRAVFTKGQVTKGQNVLITGIGGGVALFALQYAAAVGANVYVTSSDETKIERARQYGAKGGVNYRHGKKRLSLCGCLWTCAFTRGS